MSKHPQQPLAITGSINQLGQIQPIGGVNEKIEGFYDLCANSAEGLTGEQGVVIPKRQRETPVSATGCGGSRRAR